MPKKAKRTVSMTVNGTAFRKVGVLLPQFVPGQEDISNNSGEATVAPNQSGTFYTISKQFKVLSDSAFIQCLCNCCKSHRFLSNLYQSPKTQQILNPLFSYICMKPGVPHNLSIVFYVKCSPPWEWMPCIILFKYTINAQRNKKRNKKILIYPP